MWACVYVGSLRPLGNPETLKKANVYMFEKTYFGLFPTDFEKPTFFSKFVHYLSDIVNYLSTISDFNAENIPWLVTYITEHSFLIRLGDWKQRENKKIGVYFKDNFRAYGGYNGAEGPY